MPLLNPSEILTPEVAIAQKLAEVISQTEGAKKLTGLDDPALIQANHIVVGGGDADPWSPAGYEEQQLQQEHVLITIAAAEDESHTLIEPAAGVSEWDEEGILQIIIRRTPKEWEVVNTPAKQTAYLNFWDQTSSIAREIPWLGWLAGCRMRDLFRDGRPGWTSVASEEAEGLNLIAAYNLAWGTSDSGE